MLITTAHHDKHQQRSFKLHTVRTYKESICECFEIERPWEEEVRSGKRLHANGVLRKRTYKKGYTKMGKFETINPKAWNSHISFHFRSSLKFVTFASAEHLQRIDCYVSEIVIIFLSEFTALSECIISLKY